MLYFMLEGHAKARRHEILSCVEYENQLSSGAGSREETGTSSIVMCSMQGRKSMLAKNVQL